MSISIIVAIVKLDNGGLDLIYTLLIANVLIELQHSLYCGLTLARSFKPLHRDSLASNEKVVECMYKVWNSF